MSAECDAVKDAAKALIAAEEKAFSVRSPSTPTLLGNKEWLAAMDDVSEAMFRLIRAAKALVVDDAVKDGSA